jgi:hypothetical protein
MCSHWGILGSPCSYLGGIAELPRNGENDDENDDENEEED